MSDFLKIRNSTISANQSGQISLATHMRERLNPQAEARLKSSLNPLLTASQTLFATASRLQLLPQEFDPAFLQQQLIDQIQRFNQACDNKLHDDAISVGRYFLCSLLDDIVEHGPSSGFSPGYSLLTHYYQEALADNRAFMLIERLESHPAANVFLLELAYMILVYGFFGQCRFDPNGYALILEKQDALYHLIRWQHGDFRKNLFITLLPS